MADETKFEMGIKSTFDAKGTDQAAAGVRKVGQTAQETVPKIDAMAEAGKKLKAAFIELMAIAEFTAQLKEGFEQVAALEQAMNQLERATKRNGDSFDEVKGQIVGMANALKRAAGVDDDAAIKAMSELYNATGDVANAMNLVALATDVAIGAGMDFSQANDLVTKAAMGQTRGLKELRISIEETGDKTENANKALEAIRKNFGGAANDAKGLKVEINRLSEGWEDMRNNAIEKLTPALYVAINAIKSFFTALDGMWRAVADAFVGTLGVLGQFGSYMKALVTGDVQGMKNAVIGMGNELRGVQQGVLQAAEETAKKLKAIWSGAGAGGGINAGPAKSIVAGGDDGMGGAAGTDKHNPMLGPSIQEFEEYKAKVLAFEQKLIKERAAMWAKADAARRKLEDFSADEDKKRMRDIDDERERLMDEQTQRILDDVRLKKQMAEYEKQMTLDTMSMVSGALSSMFGESKEVAIAEAIINTYVGASKALAQTGIWGVIQAAIIIAAGMAQVAKIQSTEPSTKGSGFDDPGNDAAARIGGRRWAADMIGEFTRGVSAGWRDGMGGGGSSTSNTYDNRRTYNVHMHGAGLMDPTNVQMMKQFKRTLDVIDTQIEGQRTIARSR